MSERIEDIKFVLTLTFVALCGTGLTAIIG